MARGRRPKWRRVRSEVAVAVRQFPECPNTVRRYERTVAERAPSPPARFPARVATMPYPSAPCTSAFAFAAPHAWRLTARRCYERRRGCPRRRAGGERACQQSRSRLGRDPAKRAIYWRRASRLGSISIRWNRERGGGRRGQIVMVLAGRKTPIACGIANAKQARWHHMSQVPPRSGPAENKRTPGFAN